MGYGKKVSRGIGAVPLDFKRSQAGAQLPVLSAQAATAGSHSLRQIQPQSTVLASGNLAQPGSRGATNQTTPSPNNLPTSILSSSVAQKLAQENVNSALKKSATQSAVARAATIPPVIQAGMKAGLPPKSSFQKSTPTPPPNAFKFFDAKPKRIQDAQDNADKRAANDPPPNTENTSNGSDIPVIIEEILDASKTANEALSNENAPTYTAQESGGSDPSRTALAPNVAAPKKGFPWWVWLLGGLGLALAAGGIYTSTRKK